MDQAPMDKPDWYRDAVIYSVDVKTFYDADGDGWGDFQGLLDRLGYLDGLGVDCLWLRPFYPSPLKDNGYDVADYYSVDARMGTLGDFSNFVEEAHDRGIKVLIDMVFNHTSDQHPWFQRARSDPHSRYRDYYLWTNDLDSAYQQGNIFPEYEDGVWTWDDEAGSYYYHQFYHHQPDLNIHNPAVKREVHNILEFWLDLGVDGFRIDAAHPMTEPKGHHGEIVDDPIGLFKEMRRTVREKNEEAILLAEADDQPEELAKYFGDGEAFDMMFNFVMNSHLVYGLGIRDFWPLYRAFEVLPDGVERYGQWANFLRNHDEFNLLKLPHEAFEHAREFFRQDDSWLFGRGHRLRLADLLDNDHDRLAMAHSLMFAIPGTPVILSGDEIGMGADLSLPERESVRTPMQWSNNECGGFSTTDPEDLVNPVIDEGEFGYANVSVANQFDEPDSLLSRIHRIVSARKLCTEISSGVFSVVDVPPKEVWVHRIEEGRTLLMTAHNAADEPREVTVDFDAPAETTTRIVGPADYDVEDGTCTFTLGPSGYVWIRADKEGERVPLGAP